MKKNQKEPRKKLAIFTVSFNGVISEQCLVELTGEKTIKEVKVAAMKNFSGAYSIKPKVDIEVINNLKDFLRFMKEADKREAALKLLGQIKIKDITSYGDGKVEFTCVFDTQR